MRSLENYLGSFLPALVAAIAAPVAVVAILATQDVGLALLVAAFTAATLALPQLWTRHLEARETDRMDTYVTFGAEFLDTIQGILTLKSFGARRDGARRRHTHDPLAGSDGPWCCDGGARRAGRVPRARRWSQRSRPLAA